MSGQYDGPPQLRPAWLVRGGARPWTEGAAVPRLQQTCDGSALDARHGPSRPGRGSRHRRGTRAGRRVQQRRRRACRAEGAAAVSPAGTGTTARCLLAPPHLSIGESLQLERRSQTRDGHYSIGHANTRSLAPRLNEVCYLLESEKLEILCISETWLSEDVLDAVLLVPGYKLHRCDRPGGRRGGGVAILVSESLRVTRLHDSSDDDTGVEALWLSVGGVGRSTVIVGAIYRPPGALTVRLCDTLRGHFEVALATGKPVFVLGDFNVNLLNPDTADSRNFTSLLSDLNLVQLITGPTHPCPTPTLLDLALTNVPSVIDNVSVLPDLLADHYPIIIRPSSSKPRQPTSTICSRPWHRVDWNAFSLDILNANWNFFYSATDVNDKLYHFMSVWSAVVETHCPMLTRRVRRPGCPWLRDDAVRDVMAERDAARRVWAASRSVADRETYRRLRNRAKQMLTSARRTYLAELLRDDSKRFWTRLKQFGADFSQRNSIPQPPADGAGLSADQLNRHLADVGARVAADASQSVRRTDPAVQGPRPYMVCSSGFAPHCVTLPELSRVTGQLSASRAVGVDGVPLSAIRSCLPVIAPHILHLINSSISSLTFPDAWKVATVTPIHKSGDPLNPVNFRPISILPAMSKILEKVVSSQLSSYLITNHIISSSQYACRPSHSTEDALLEVVEWAARRVDVGEVTCLTSIDLSKAFDSVDHSMLLNKLEWYGISSGRFRSYLSGRSQLIRGGTAAALPLTHGVPQGSIVGPIIFLIFVNDLPCFLPNGHLLSYADDTQILDSAPSNHDDLLLLQSRAEENIRLLQHWFSLNSLKMNTNKTSLMLLGTRNSLAKTTDFALNVNDVSIRPEKKVKILGVFLDPTLTWETHVAHIVRRTNAILVSLYKIRHHLSPELLKILIQTHIFPHLQFCSSVWGGAASCRLDRLQKVIHFAARLVSGLRRHDHVTPTLRALGWSSVRTMVVRRDAVNVYRGLHVTDAPKALRDMFRPRSAVSDRSTRATAAGTTVLELPRFRLASARRLFPYRAAAS